MLFYIKFKRRDIKHTQILMKTFAVALITQHKIVFKHFSPVLEKADTGPLYCGLGMKNQNCSGAVDYFTCLDNTVANKPNLEIKVMLKSQQQVFPCGSSFWKSQQSSFCNFKYLLQPKLISVGCKLIHAFTVGVGCWWDFDV